jgi:hypothetical protein
LQRQKALDGALKIFAQLLLKPLSTSGLMPGQLS